MKVLTAAMLAAKINGNCPIAKLFPVLEGASFLFYAADGTGAQLKLEKILSKDEGANIIAGSTFELLRKSGLAERLNVSSIKELQGKKDDKSDPESGKRKAKYLKKIGKTQYWDFKFLVFSKTSPEETPESVRLCLNNSWNWLFGRTIILIMEQFFNDDDDRRRRRDVRDVSSIF